MISTADGSYIATIPPFCTGMILWVTLQIHCCKVLKLCIHNSGVWTDRGKNIACNTITNHVHSACVFFVFFDLTIYFRVQSLIRVQLSSGLWFHFHVMCIVYDNRGTAISFHFFLSLFFFPSSKDDLVNFHHPYIKEKSTGSVWKGLSLFHIKDV